MIVCHCNYISQKEIEDTIIELLELDRLGLFPTVGKQRDHAEVHNERMLSAAETATTNFYRSVAWRETHQPLMLTGTD